MGVCISLFVQMKIRGHNNRKLSWMMALGAISSASPWLSPGTSSLLVFLTATTKMEVVDWTLELSTCTIARDLRGRNRVN